MERYLTAKEASELLNVSHHTLANWRWRGNGPAYYYVGGSPRYRREDLDAFIHPAASTADRRYTDRAKSPGRNEYD